MQVGGEHSGTLRYKGPVQFASGFWAGVELDLPEGTSNGFKEGEEYFKCPDKHGLFAPPEKVALLSQPENILSMKAEDFLVDLSTPQSPKEEEVEVAGFDGVEGDESMTSLDRAISSAENAVKGFVEESKAEEQETKHQEKQEEDKGTDVRKEQPSFVEMLDEVSLTQK